MNIWVIRAGHGGYYADDCREHGVVALGWAEMGDLSDLRTRDDILRGLKEAHPNAKRGRLIAWASQLFKLVHEVQIGDIILTPVSATRQIHMGKVAGEYRYLPDVIEDKPQTRPVEWSRTISRDDLSLRARNSAGSTLTLFSMAEHRDELLHLFEHGPTAAVEPSTLLDLTGEKPRILRPDAIDAAAIDRVVRLL